MKLFFFSIEEYFNTKTISWREHPFASRSFALYAVIDMKSKTKTCVIIVAIIIVIAAIFMFVTKNPKNAGQTNSGGGICAMDAMQCPDGSYVGRTGPNCQFVCPVSHSNPNAPMTIQ